MTKPKIWHGSADLEPMLRPIGELRVHPHNPRQGDVGALMTLLQHHGQIKPIVTHPDDDGLVIAGNHTLMAMQQLGWTHVATTIYGGDDPDGFLLADNRSAELASYDDVILAALVSERAVAGTLLGTGYDGDDADQLIADQSLQGDIDEAIAGVGKPDAPGPKAGEQGTVFNLVFDDYDQQQDFYEILKRLKVKHPDLPTHAARLVETLSEAMSDA